MDDDLSELAICAVRYALGRMTYVSLSVPNAIMKYKLSLTTNALHVMLRDIKEYRDLHEKLEWIAMMRVGVILNSGWSKKLN